MAKLPENPIARHDAATASVRLATSALTPLITHTIALICDMLDADGGIIGIRHGNDIEPIASYNTPIHLLNRPLVAMSILDGNFHDAFPFRGDEPLSVLLSTSSALWTNNLVLTVKHPTTADHIVLVIGRNSEKMFQTDTKSYARINLARQVIREEFSVLRDFSATLSAEAENRNRVVEERKRFLHRELELHPNDAGSKAVPAGNRVSSDPNLIEPHPLVEFLFDTLVQIRHIATRGDASYTSLRRWRRPIKPFQINAVRVLKRNLDEGFVQRIAAEMAGWVENAFGQGMFDAVVSVPCGHSGPQCLSERLGQAVGQRLGIGWDDVFNPLVVKGSSHPRTNASRPKMKLSKQPDGRILLIDDIVSSGSHMSEAIRTLRGATGSVVGLAWIADG